MVNLARSIVVSLTRRWRDASPYLPKALLIFALLIVAFGYGYEASYRGWFPRHTIIEAHSFYSNLKFQLLGNETYGIVRADEVPLSEFERARIKTAMPVGATEKLLISGGAGEFLDYCPQNGCLAVVLTRQGRLVTAVPFLPKEFEKKPLINVSYDRLFRHIERDIKAGSVFPLPDGDFIFNIEDRGSDPLGGGIARLHANGKIVWYRRDYAHHWSSLDADGHILSPSYLGGGTGLTTGSSLDPKCRISAPRSDTFEIVDVRGRRLREVPVIAMLAKSRFRSILSETYDICDVVHLNFVREAGSALAARWKGVSPRDYLVSLRHLSAFAILDAQDGHVKQLVRGTFVRQHSVQPLPDGRIVMFDNEGMSEGGRSSRVLILDPVDWSERTLFPTAQSPTAMDTYSTTGGYVDVSPDGKRLWMTISQKGVCYEIEIATGKVLTIYNNFHPAIGRDGKPQQVLRRMVSQVQYFH